MALPEVQVELYVNGKGPRNTFQTKLQGWDANRLDLETIMNTYRLEALYAYSTSEGRGQRLILHPRNGFSLVCYSGKPGSVIRLDSDPKMSRKKMAFLATVIISVIILFSLAFVEDSDKPLWFKKFQEIRGGGAWVVGFVVLAISQVTGWFRMKFH